MNVIADNSRSPPAMKANQILPPLPNLNLNDSMVDHHGSYAMHDHHHLPLEHEPNVISRHRAQSYESLIPYHKSVGGYKPHLSSVSDTSDMIYDESVHQPLDISHLESINNKYSQTLGAMMGHSHSNYYPSSSSTVMKRNKTRQRRSGSEPIPFFNDDNIWNVNSNLIVTPEESTFNSIDALFGFDSIANNIQTNDVKLIQRLDELPVTPPPVSEQLIIIQELNHKLKEAKKEIFNLKRIQVLFIFICD